MSPNLYNLVEKISGELYYRALTKIPPDTSEAINTALKDEASSTGRQILTLIKKNIETAEEKGRIICQDTGTPIYLVEISNM